VTAILLWLSMNAMIVTDWGQTRYIASHPAEYHEQFNPLIYGHPSMGKVNAYFLANLAFHNGIMIALPKKYRPYYAAGVTAVETHFVISNNQIGIKIDF
jgi:hypothetical protein